MTVLWEGKDHRDTDVSLEKDSSGEVDIIVRDTFESAYASLDVKMMRGLYEALGRELEQP